MTPEIQTITTPDDIELFVRIYRAAKPVPSRTIYWVHGMGEHGGRYDHVMQVLAERGWTTVIPDLRGHGQSSGIPIYVKSFDDYLEDIGLVWQKTGLLDTSSVLLGHSMGGLIAVRAVQSAKVTASRLVLSSPLLGVKVRVNPFVLFFGSIAGRILPTIRLSNRVDPANMTHDPEFIAMRRNDPLMNKTVTTGWYVAMRAALKAAHRDVDKMTLPTMALQGTLDGTTDPDAMENWWKRIRVPHKELIMLGDHYHELFFESDWHTTAMQILDWLEAKEQS